MKIGIYGSSFDPITYGHLWTANTVAARKKLDRVIFLPASGRRLDKRLHASDEHRWNMVNLAIEGNARFAADRQEMDALPGKQYTYYTMESFSQRYPNDDIYFIMGADLLPQLSSWRMGQDLIQRHKFIVMARAGHDMLETIAKDPLLRNHDDGRFELIHKGFFNEISSSYIRDEFSSGGDPRYLLPDACYQYIVEHKLYNISGWGGNRDASRSEATPS